MICAPTMVSSLQTPDRSGTRDRFRFKKYDALGICNRFILECACLFGIWHCFSCCKRMRSDSQFVSKQHVVVLARAFFRSMAHCSSNMECVWANLDASLVVLFLLLVLSVARRRAR